MNIDTDKIISYLSDDLDEKEKSIFNKKIENNPELKNLLNDIKINDAMLKDSVKYKTSSNFIVDLNQRIDQYELENISWVNKIFNLLNSSSRVPQLGALCILFVFSFTLYKVTDSSFKNNYSNDLEEKSLELIANNDDSLFFNADSTGLTPTLLYSKDK